jgi:hypothetical protein
VAFPSDDPLQARSKLVPTGKSNEFRLEGQADIPIGETVRFESNELGDVVRVYSGVDYFDRVSE